MAEKPVVEVAVTGINFVAIDTSTGTLKILFDTSGRQDIALSLPIEVVALLEAKLAQAREQQKSRSRPQ